MEGLESPGKGDTGLADEREEERDLSKLKYVCKEDGEGGSGAAPAGLE